MMNISNSKDKYTKYDFTLVLEKSFLCQGGQGGRGSIGYRGTRPVGGNGGTGGHVIVEGSHDVINLSHIRFSHIRGDQGEDGTKQGKDGKSACDKIIILPLNTKVYFIIDPSDVHKYQVHVVTLTQHGERHIIANGGLGGLGNSTRRFNTPVHGMAGTVHHIKVEYYPSSDFCLIGNLGAGKSYIFHQLLGLQHHFTPQHQMSIGNYLDTEYRSKTVIDGKPLSYSEKDYQIMINAAHLIAVISEEQGITHALTTLKSIISFVNHKSLSVQAVIINKSSSYRQGPYKSLVPQVFFVDSTSYVTQDIRSFLCQLYT